MVSRTTLFFSLFFFFFQAEDGIRDIGVTGVQTCALPIALMRAARAARTRRGPPRVANRGHRQRCDTNAHWACKSAYFNAGSATDYVREVPTSPHVRSASIGQHPGATGDAFPSAKGRS